MAIAKPLNPPPDESPALTLNPRGIAELAADLQRRAAAQPNRVILAIAGVPGSGKSTLARALAIHLNRAQPGNPIGKAQPPYAVTLGLDAFHLPNARLQTLGLTDRKGSPPTFDSQGYLKLLDTCRDPKRTLDLPSYDRRLHEPVYTGKPEDRAGPATRIVITEGNYLLMDMLPWTTIDDLADPRMFLETPPDHARNWLIRRHIAVGRSMAEAITRVEENDAVNAKLVLERSRHADRVVCWPDSAYER